MKPHRQRRRARRPASLVSLLSATAATLLVFSALTPSEASTAIQHQNGQGSIHQTNSAQPLPGQDAVHGALSQLYPLRPAALRRYSSSGGSGSKSKPSNIFSLSWYYLKQLFILLFMNGPSTTASTSSTIIPGSSSSQTAPKIAQPALTAIQLLEHAATLDNPDAMYLLADMHFYGKYTVPRNFTYAFENYKRLADMTGNGTAQHLVGFMYATGIGGAVEKDQAKALLYHTFAADGGDLRAKMTTAYRYHAGIGAPRNCELAVEYYAEISEKAVAYLRSGPPGGRTLSKDAFRLADEDGGLYGEGASTTSSISSDVSDNMVEFYNILSQTGQARPTFGLGKLHYYGSRTVRPDYRKAKDYFLNLARRYWTKDGQVRRDTEPGLDKLASKAAGYLGAMFLRAEGMEQNFDHAKTWFKRGIENGDAQSQYSMGLMYLRGLSVPQDAVKAAEYFMAAADQDYTDAHVRLGALFMDQGDLQTAAKYFDLAARKENTEAFYYLAEMNNLPIAGLAKDANPMRNCNNAAHYYKLVVEKVEALHSSFKEANDAYDDGDLDTALLLYMMAAEQGYEAAQANVAYILDQQRVAASPGWFALSKFVPASLNFGRRSSLTLGQIRDASRTALIYWTRSAKQANIDSMLKMGDYYLANIGVDPSFGSASSQSSSRNSSSSDASASSSTSSSSSSSSSNHTSNTESSALKAFMQANSEKAAACYSAAAETMQSAQAYFNLGWMHENGLGGLTQDFYLAKRFYDLAVDVSSESHVPVTLALMKLRVRSFWNRISGGQINSIPDDEADAKKRKRPSSFAEWFADFLTADLEGAQARQQQQRHHGADRDHSADGGGGAGLDPADADLYWGDAAPAAAAGNNYGDYYGHDDGYGTYTYAHGRDGEDDDDDRNYRRADDDEDDAGIETIIIVGLAAALATLLFYRQQRQLARMREEADERQRVRSRMQATTATTQDEHHPYQHHQLGVANNALNVPAAAATSPAGDVGGSGSSGDDNNSARQRRGVELVGANEGNRGDDDEEAEADRGVFRRPGDSNFNNTWAASGGIGH